MSFPPDIPEDRLQAARRSFAPYDDGETVLGLVDNTVVAGDQGLLLTTRRIFFTAAAPRDGKPGVTAYARLGYTAPDDISLNLEDGTVIPLAADPKLVHDLVCFLNDARDAAGGPAVLTPAQFQPVEEADLARCWFCGRHPPDKSATLPTRLRRQARVRALDATASIDLNTEIVTISVPRCTRCAAAHAGREKLEQWMIGGGFLLFLSVWIGLWRAGYPKAGFVAGAALGLGLTGYLLEELGLSRRFLPEGVKAPIEKIDFPAAKRLETEGWTQTERKENFYTQSQDVPPPSPSP